MNNQYNNYNNQGYNGYNQQQMNQQQPMNQGYDQPVYNQPSNSNKSGRAGGIIVVIIILIGLVVFLLNYTGVIDLSGKSKDGNETKEVSDKNGSTNTNKDKGNVKNYKDELKALCSKVDSKGNYKEDEFESRIEQNNRYAENDQIDEAIKVLDKFLHCSSGICEVTDNNIQYAYSCYDDSYYVLKDFLEYNNYSFSQAGLRMACDSGLDYEDVKCENNVCRTIHTDSDNYSLDCNKYKNWFNSINKK